MVNGKMVRSVNPCNVENFSKKIDSSKLADCFKKALHALEKVDNNCFAHTISIFSGETPGFNWVVEEGTAGGDNGKTSSRYNQSTGSVRSEFNSANFTGATDLAVAKTLIHESVHAYIVAFFHTSQDPAKTYSQLNDEWIAAKRPDLNELHHNEMVRDFVGEIGALLKEYGISKGYNISDQYYKDLAWGGLHETKAFKALSQSEKNRVMDVINTEQSGTDRNGNTTTQKGKPSGC
jgi:hypothetical protein